MIIKKVLTTNVSKLILAGIILLCGGAAIIKPEDDASDEFTIAILPDTQYYTSEKNGGKNEMFISQTKWIAENAKK